jgi:hypothetical protein
MPLVLQGATSGQATINPTDAATVTLTLPSTSGTLSVSGGSPSFTTITTTNDASISGLTVGKGGGAVASNTALGAAVLATNSTGSSNTGVGNSCLYLNTGSENTAVGQAAMQNNSSGGSNVAFGRQALYSNTTASNNTALGYQSIYTNSPGACNTGLGWRAGYLNTTGYNNTAIGWAALNSNTTAYENTAVGYYSLLGNTTGLVNTAVGTASLQSNTTGSFNVAVGHSALITNTTSTENTAVGYQAGLNTTVGGNTYLGHNAGRYVTTADSNVCVGNAAGAYSPNQVTTGNGNICVGAYSGVAAGSNTYSIVIGYGVNGRGSSTGLISPQGGGVYQGNNSSTWSTTSDQRLKKNIVDNNTGLEKIAAIQVRNFEYRTADEVTELEPQNAINIQGVQLGAIAQELQTILPECVKTESTGVMSVDTTNLTWYLINAVKELKATVDAQAARIASLEGAK